MSDVELRLLERRDWSELSDLICASLNYWHHTHGRTPVFRDGPEACNYMAEIYEALDPGCCVVAVRPGTGRLMGACFWHERETHVSVGIMAVHPNYGGKGVASRLLRHITDIADAKKLPTRLVSSAINLDSFSLYNRAGFVPIEVYQDMIVEGRRRKTEDGSQKVEGVELRDATVRDVEGMVRLEEEVSGIRRGKDYRFFLEGGAGEWTTSVAVRGGEIVGHLTTLKSARGATVGPGVVKEEAVAIGLLARELGRAKGMQALVLVPCRYRELVGVMYRWGGRNVEIHLAQVRGAYQAYRGVTFPTFMPESG